MINLVGILVPPINPFQKQIFKSFYWVERTCINYTKRLCRSWLLVFLFTGVSAQILVRATRCRSWQHCVIAQVTNRLQDCRSMLKILPVAAGENPNFKTTSVNPALILRWFEMIKILLNTFELLFSLFSLNGMV